MASNKSIEELIAENSLLRTVLLGATMTVTVDEDTKQQIMVSDLLLSRQSDSPCVEDSSNKTKTLLAEGTGRDQSDMSPVLNRGSSSGRSTSMSAGGLTKDPNKPVFTKKDFLSVLEEKNIWKEKADQLEEELEEWKRAASDAQDRVEILEQEIAEVQERLGGFYYRDEIQADVLGLLPKGPNFRPQPLVEVSEIYVTDVEVSGWVQQESKFLFAIQLTWSDKRRFEIYRRYGEFFTLQNTLLLLFPEEAGKRKSVDRVIPSLPTADNVLAIFGATNTKSAVESRLQLIDGYCNTLLLQLPKKISRCPLVFDFFKARPSDKQLESLKRPLHHSMELSVYPLVPQGKPQGLYIAIAEYDATKEKDKTNKISLEVRESVRVVKEDDSGWWFVQKTETGDCGFVPSSFIKKVGDPSIPRAPIDPSVLGFVTSTCITASDTTTDHHSLSTEAAGVSISPTELTYVSIYEYQATDASQLSFPEGVEILIIDKSEDGWWFGTYKGKEGWIPSSYIETPAGTSYEDKIGECDVEGQEYITINNYTAKEEDEISLPSGVKVTVLDKSFTGWWKVKYRNHVGFAPATALTLPSNSPSSPDDVPIILRSISPNTLLHSMSGIKKPPPRRKHVQKQRAKTFIVPIEEREEPPLLTATTVCDEDTPITLSTRRTSIKNFLRRSTLESKKAKKGT